MVFVGGNYDFEVVQLLLKRSISKDRLPLLVLTSWTKTATFMIFSMPIQPIAAALRG